MASILSHCEAFYSKLNTLLDAEKYGDVSIRVEGFVECWNGGEDQFLASTEFMSCAGLNCLELSSVGLLTLICQRWYLSPENESTFLNDVWGWLIQHSVVHIGEEYFDELLIDKIQRFQHVSVGQMKFLLKKFLSTKYELMLKDLAYIRTNGDDVVRAYLEYPDLKIHGLKPESALYLFVILI